MRISPRACALFFTVLMLPTGCAQDGNLRSASAETKIRLSVVEVVQEGNLWEIYPAFYNLGVVLGHLGEYTEAIALLKRATVLNPDYQAAYQEMARFYIEMGDYKSAEETYELLRKVERTELE